MATYQELTEALENAALQVETMGAIIGCLLQFHAPNGTSFSNDEIKNNNENYDVLVVPGSDYISLLLKDKNE